MNGDRALPFFETFVQSVKDNYQSDKVQSMATSSMCNVIHPHSLTLIDA
jgi:hypothetical protein